jgi:nucleoside-diphosphate-sugar epimerase
LIDLVGREVGSPVPLDRRPAQPGDVFRTGGDITAAVEGLGWRPTVSVAEGVKAQVAWALANT